MKIEELMTVLNNGSKADLIKISGIGSVLADRIMNARPFDTLDSVQSVQGLSEAMFTQWLATEEEEETIFPNLEPAKKQNMEQKISSEPDASKTVRNDFGDSARESLNRVGDVLKDRTHTARKAVKEGLSSMGETVREQTQSLSDLPERLEKVSQERGPLWTIMISSAITIFISLILILLVLASINGSLKFATSAEYRVLQRESAQNTTRIETMQKDLDGLRGRVNTLEGLGERMVVLEKTQGQVTEELKSVKDQMSLIQTDMDTLNEKVTIQEERTARFDEFLKNLQTMLGSLLAPQGETK